VDTYWPTPVPAGTKATGRSLVQRVPCVCVCVCVCVWCVCVGGGVCRCNSNPLHLQWLGRRGHTKKERKKERKRYLLDSGGKTVRKLKARHRRRGKGKDVLHHDVQAASCNSTCTQYTRTCKTMCLISYIVQERTVSEHNIKIIRKASFQRTLNVVSYILRRGGSVRQWRNPSCNVSRTHAHTHTRTRAHTCARAFGNVSCFNNCIYCHNEHSVSNTLHSTVICYMFWPFLANIGYILEQHIGKGIPRWTFKVHTLKYIQFYTIIPLQWIIKIKKILAP